MARDDTTRYLCAAAHLDSAYADAAIREFLVEPTRAVPPSPGVDAAAVLSEAVAARTRRKIRDTALVVLVIGFAFTLPITLLLLWIGVALALSFSRLSALPRTDRGSKNASMLVILGFAVILAVVLVPPLLDKLGQSLNGTSRSARPLPSLGNGDADTVLGTILFVLIVTVLLADRFTVWKLVTKHFGKYPANRRPLPSIKDRAIFRYSPTNNLALLDRYLRPMQTMAPDPGSSDDKPGEPVPVIVHRGYKPFVGAGFTYRPWSIAVPLVRSGRSKDDTTLTTAALYLGVAEEIDKLREATSLTPGDRLRELTIDEQILIPATELIDHLADPVAREFLSDLNHPPYTLLSERRSLEIRDNPIEWARYYLCIQVETWDRDLVMTIYVHVAMDESTLYVEWTPCLLTPINQQYQRIDTMTSSAVLPLRQTLVTLLKLPVTLPERLWRTVKIIRPVRRDRGIIDPDMFGSLFSLRELAAGPGTHNYFQRADTDRYLKILQGRYVRAVSTLMRRAGYATASFERQAATVFNNNVHIGGSVVGNVQAGNENTAGTVTVGDR